MAKKELAAHWLRASGLGWALREARLWSGLVVANYHRVGDGATSRFNQDLFSATADDFDAQIRFFKNNFDVVQPQDLDGVRGAARGRYLQITFDDGYRDNYEIAFPILQAQGVGATFFVATGYLDKPCVPWWDEIAWMIRGSKRSSLPSSAWLSGSLPLDQPTRVNAIRELGRIHLATPLAKQADFLNYLAAATGSGRCDSETARDLWMTWDMTREMRRGGMSFGGHTVNHIELSRLSRQEQAEEIRASKQRLEEELGEPMSVFSYPFGQVDSFNDDTRSALHECGMKFAYTYYGGYQRQGHWDMYNLKRVAIETFKSLDMVEAMVTIPQVFA